MYYEAKEKGDFQSITAIKVDEKTPIDDILQLCLDISTKVESGMFVYFDKEISHLY